MKKITILTVALAFITSLGICQIVVNGSVKNNKNQPLPGASVILLSSYIGTSTNSQGNFQLTINQSNAALVARYLGFKPDTIYLENQNLKQDLSFTLQPNAIEQSEIIITGTRAKSNTPTSYTDVSKEDIEKMNFGQDIPFILNLTPSVLVSSDAGAGVGYTDMRIRGTDVTRINVTVNGIPLNDAESQGVFWVNMPDLSSSLNSIQIQRGVGTSTNGASAFGASVNLQTDNSSSEPYAETNIGYGSFNTQKYNVKFGSGLLKNNWAFDGRLSSITSDGYIDRATSDLKSYYLTGGYYGEKTTLKLVHFAGKEVTYQSWYGTPEAVINNNQEQKLNYALTEGLSQEQTENLLNSGRTYNHYLYENEVDNYQQNHYQAHLTHKFSTKLAGNISLHYTRGFGYFEQYRTDDDFSDYGLNNPIIGSDTITSTDLIRRRWLDNDFYGFVYNLNYQNNNYNIDFGGAANIYEGDHFGEIIWSEIATESEKDFTYYHNFGRKSDANAYIKGNINLSKKLNLFADMQFRNVIYSNTGRDNDLRNINIAETYNFINPKGGITYYVNQKNKAYFSVAVANREPSRTDFLDAALQKPQHETLVNYELGIERTATKYKSAINFYYMDYNNQLIATGELNDVGALVKTNVKESFRAGVELQLAYQIFNKLNWQANYTYSINQIASFNEVLYDYTNGFDVIVNNYTNTQMALSPNHIAKSILSYQPIKNAELGFITTIVSKQYLDNTTNENRAIEGYLVNDFRASYNFSPKFIKNVELSVLVNNLFNELYSARGYTYSYVFGDLITQNHYYPQATRNFLAALKFTF